MCPAPVKGNAEFARPTPEDVIRVAIDTFEAGERVDMAAMSQRLGVGRSTLYRWVGDREALMDRVIEATTIKLATAVQERFTGTGLQYTLSAVREYLLATTAYEPLRSLAQREPNLALHIFFNPDGAFAASTLSGLRQRLDADLPDVVISDETLMVINATSLAMAWASIAGGYEPQIDEAVNVIRTVLEAVMAAQQT
jgi:AcrR family transcriptional regulator